MDMATQYGTSFRFVQKPTLLSSAPDNNLSCPIQARLPGRARGVMPCGVHAAIGQRCRTTKASACSRHVGDTASRQGAMTIAAEI
jgi:hypothetical protein